MSRPGVLVANSGNPPQRVESTVKLWLERQTLQLARAEEIVGYPIYRVSDYSRLGA